MFCASFSSPLHPLESQKLPSKNKQCQHAASPRRLNFPAAPRKSNKKLLESDLIFDRKHQVKHVEQRFLCNKSHTGNAGVPHMAQEPGWLRLAQAQQPGGGSGFLWSLGGSNTSACPAPTMRTSGAPGHPAEESGWGGSGWQFGNSISRGTGKKFSPVASWGFSSMWLFNTLHRRARNPLFLRGQAENLQLVSQQWGKDKSLQADAATMVSNISPASNHTL